MKKIYAIICSFIFAFINVNATTVNIAVGVNGVGAPANMFTPSTVSAVVGDVIQFVLGAGVHNVTSTSVPGGATAMSSGTMSTPLQTYNYTVTVAGTYSYECTFHPGMTGTINVTVPAGVTTPTIDLLTTIYPNPFKETVTLKYGKQVGSLKIFNVIGEQVKSLELSPNNDKTVIDFGGIPSGIYFIRTYKEETPVETKKIIKA